MHLFYASDIDSSRFEFSREESRHCKVLRLNTSDTIYLTNGKGRLFHAIINDADQNAYKATIVKTINDFNKRTFKLHIAIAPTKSPDRFEWFLEKATEIGIDEITPLICEHSEKTVVKTDRLEKIMVSALKQSFSAYLPKLNACTTFSNFMLQNFQAAKFVAYCNDSERKLLKNEYIAPSNAVVLIGPEGDFSEAEISAAKKSGYMPISLGNNRLRTETAGIVACNIINIANQ
ncbi:MAG: 16S rRNA (uracil(1498)-N(3))-methyltransferase [Bacteroidota bacterium]